MMMYLMKTQFMPMYISIYQANAEGVWLWLELQYKAGKLKFCCFYNQEENDEAEDMNRGKRAAGGLIEIDR